MSAMHMNACEHKLNLFIHREWNPKWGQSQVYRKHREILTNFESFYIEVELFWRQQYQGGDLLAWCMGQVVSVWIWLLFSSNLFSVAELEVTNRAGHSDL